MKSEYFDGHPRAKAGASRAHNLITLNLASEIRMQLKERRCETYAGDMRVHVGPAEAYTYPDVAVVCGDAQFLDEELHTLVNATVVIEVLSASTEADDRGIKFAAYRRLASLKEYILVAQERMCVERYARQGDGWILTEFSDPVDALRLNSIGCEINLREVYAKVLLAWSESPDGG